MKIQWQVNRNLEIDAETPVLEIGHHPYLGGGPLAVKFSIGLSDQLAECEKRRGERLNVDRVVAACSRRFAIIGD
jgi:hypothetical protein